MPTRNELAAAFAATTYRVFLPGGEVDLKVSCENNQFGAWLEAAGCREWALITAYNPGGVRRENSINKTCQAALEVKLLEMDYELLAGESLADAGEWPVEETCLAPGLPRDRALALAREFGQAALLWGDSATPQLLWVEEEVNRG